MPRRVAISIIVGLALGAVACTGPPPSASLPRVTLADANECPTTQPARGPSDLEDSLFGWESSFGVGELWVGGRWPDGVIAARPEFLDKDGSVGMKFGWWRRVAGDLTITGRRLDGPAPPVTASIPSGYGDRGFQPAGVTFPTEGCWEVTGKAGTSTLTFVTFVIKSTT